MIFRPRVIPVLLLRGHGLVKTEAFDAPRYLGDPVNIVRLFNDKGVDELVLLDIEATETSTSTDEQLLSEIASEAFVPVGVGGGIDHLGQIARRLDLGFEKVVLSSRAVEQPAFVEEAAREFGSSTLAVVLDVKPRRFGQIEVVTRRGRNRTGRSPVETARELAERGAGEVIVQSVHRDGTMGGYDLEVIQSVSAAVDVPVVALGGAGTVDDLAAAIGVGASAAAAGSMFVFQGPRRAVLVNYPSDAVLDSALSAARAKAE